LENITRFLSLRFPITHVHDLHSDQINLDENLIQFIQLASFLTISQKRATEIIQEIIKENSQRIYTLDKVYLYLFIE